MSILKCARWQEAKDAAVETELGSTLENAAIVAQALKQIYVARANHGNCFSEKKNTNNQQEKQGKSAHKGERISETPRAISPVYQCVKRAGEGPAKDPGTDCRCRIGIGSEIEQRTPPETRAMCGAPVPASKEVAEKVQRAVQSTHDGTIAR